MHPHIKEEKSGKCPVCQMNLTKVTIEEGDDHAETNVADNKIVYQCKNFPDVTSEKPDTCPLDGTPMVKKESGPSPSDTIAKVKLRKSQLNHFQPAIVFSYDNENVKKAAGFRANQICRRKAFKHSGKISCSS